jgi:hypothetical protein
MFILMLIKRFQRLREQKKLGAWSALWLLFVVELALIEFRIICFCGPLCLVIYERLDNWRNRSDGPQKPSVKSDREG